MKNIQLTQGKITIVDDDDYDFLIKNKWFYNQGYALRRERGRTIQMHRVILNPEKKFEVDHIDGNGLNNTKSNLRLVTHHQNIFNSRKREGANSKFKGVTKDWNRWRARIQFNKKPLYLGGFITQEEAAMAYDKMAKKLFGKYARLNF